MSARLPSLHTSESEYISIRRKQGLYVDKTHHFASLLAEDNKYVFLARPRRFGKTLLIATLEAYFQGDLTQVRPVDDQDRPARPAPVAPTQLFAGTAVQDIAPLQPIHPVIRLNMAYAAADTAQELVRKLQLHLERVYTQWYRRGVNVGLEPCDPALNRIRFEDATDPALRLTDLIDCLEQHYRRSPVVLIDEYDAPVTHLLGTDMPAAPFLRVLRNFYGVLKSSENALRLVFIAGISRFAHVNLFSALNNLQDITLNPLYADLCGFTESEVQNCLQPYLEVGAQHLGCSSDDLLSKLRDYYNGYRFGLTGREENVYNPFSLAACLNGVQHQAIARQWQELGWPNFWAESGTPEFLVRLVQEGQFTLSRQLPSLDGLLQVAYTLENLDYRILMWQTGYYTVRRSGRSLYLAYPNKEVSLTYAQSLLKLYTEVPDYPVLRGLHTALREERYDTFCHRLTTFMAGVPGEKLRKETDCHLVLHALCQLMQVDFQSEVHEWGGRSDMVVQFSAYVCVIELKYHESVRAAIRQIQQHAYGRRYHDGTRRVVGLGLNFMPGKSHEGPSLQFGTVELYRPQISEPVETSRSETRKPVL